MEYTKPALTLEQKVERLKDRGLTIENPDKALHLLARISYYRLSGYFYPLLEDKENHIFKSGSTFQQAFNMYCFDRRLRALVLGELEKIEVAVRTQLTYHFSHAEGAFWFMDGGLFNSSSTHEKLLATFTAEYERSDELFVKTFKRKYTNPYPPSWILFELISFGALSRAYSSIKKYNKEKAAVADYFGLPDHVFASWLHSLTYIRNVCAHHARLWNREHSVSPILPRKPRKQWLRNKPSDEATSTYVILSVIVYLLQTVNPKTTFKQKIRDLLAAYPTVDKAAMGFPRNWEDERLWQ